MFGLITKYSIEMNIVKRNQSYKRGYRDIRGSGRKIINAIV